MDNILHILNGDIAIAPLEESGIRGDHLVWREVLSEVISITLLLLKSFGREKFLPNNSI